MPSILLPRRLEVICDLVPSGALVADIGTDHAHLPISLIQSGKCTKAFACDIVDGPLAAAKKNISAHKLDDKIVVIKSDGLENVVSHKPDCIVIAGMGGETIRDILSESDYSVLSGATLILQPMTHSELLREHLIKRGFSILDERVVREQNRFYVIIKAQFKAEQKHYFNFANAVYELGGISAKTLDAGKEYLIWRQKLAKKTLEQIKKSASENPSLLEHHERVLFETEQRLLKN